MPDGVPTHTNANSAFCSPWIVVEREPEATRLEVAGDDLLEAGLEDRNLATTEPFDFVRIDIDTDDLVTQLCKTGGGYQPDVVRSNYRNRGHVSESNVYRGGAE